MTGWRIAPRSHALVRAARSVGGASRPCWPRSPADPEIVVQASSRRLGRRRHTSPATPTAASDSPYLQSAPASRLDAAAAMAGADDPREREYHSKWVTLSATIVVMLSAGMNYTFSMWGSALGRRLGYSVEQMGGLATACSVGSYLNVFPGVFYDRLKAHDRRAPRQRNKYTTHTVHTGARTELRRTHAKTHPMRARA